MPRPLKFEEIRHLLRPELRRELDALKKPGARRRVPRPQVKAPEPPIATGPVPGGSRGPWSEWTFRKCDRCKCKFLAPPEVTCPLLCWEWMPVSPGRKGKRTEERDGRDREV